MTFTHEKRPVYRCYDIERDLEISTAVSAKTGNRNEAFQFIHKIGDRTQVLGGGVYWFYSTRPITEEEKPNYPEKVKAFSTIVVGFSHIPGEANNGRQRGSAQIDGYSRSESLKIIEEALLEYQLVNTMKKHEGVSIYDVEFNDYILTWLEEDT